jgi:DNA-binding CsgD family transcriptional regulator
LRDRGPTGGGEREGAPSSSALNLVVDSLVSEIAEWACQAPSRQGFRRGVVDRLRVVLSLEAAAFASLPPSPGGETTAVWNTSVPRLVSLWSQEAAELRARLRPPARWLLCGPGERDWSATGCELMCCVLRVGERSISALSISRFQPFTTDELSMLGQLQPVLQLGDERQVEVGESVGVRLSPRERQIFEYLVRGFRNEDIARALGTSPATVRNQLVRLYRKTGVATRSELVGLATSRLLVLAAAGGAR